jgi:hypothetical protein
MHVNYVTQVMVTLLVLAHFAVVDSILQEEIALAVIALLKIVILALMMDKVV